MQHLWSDFFLQSRARTTLGMCSAILGLFLGQEKNPSHSIVSVCRSIKPTNKLRKSVILHSDYHNNYIVICVGHTVVSKRLRPNPSIHLAAGTLIFYNWISTVTTSREQYMYLVTRSDDDNNASR